MTLPVITAYAFVSRCTVTETDSEGRRWRQIGRSSSARRHHAGDRTASISYRVRRGRPMHAVHRAETEQQLLTHRVSPLAMGPWQWHEVRPRERQEPDGGATERYSCRSREDSIDIGALERDRDRFGKILMIVFAPQYSSRRAT